MIPPQLPRQGWPHNVTVAEAKLKLSNPTSRRVGTWDLGPIGTGRVHDLGSHRCMLRPREKKVRRDEKGSCCKRVIIRCHRVHRVFAQECTSGNLCARQVRPIPTSDFSIKVQSTPYRPRGLRHYALRPASNTGHAPWPRRRLAALLVLADTMTWRPGCEVCTERALLQLMANGLSSNCQQLSCFQLHEMEPGRNVYARPTSYSALVPCLARCTAPEAKTEYSATHGNVLRLGSCRRATDDWLALFASAVR